MGVQGWDNRQSDSARSGGTKRSGSKARRVVAALVRRGLRRPETKAGEGKRKGGRGEPLGAVAWHGLEREHLWTHLQSGRGLLVINQQELQK